MSDLKVSFGHQHPLKMMWKNDLFPSVRYGIYGLKDKLEKDTVSLEHVIPISRGGLTDFDNLVLATQENNHKRGAENIFLFTTEENVMKYLEQFKNIVVLNFSGNKYIEDLMKTFERVKRQLKRGYYDFSR